MNRIRKMKKQLLTMGIALGLVATMFICCTSSSVASTCSKSPNGAHDYSAHRGWIAGYSVPTTQHWYWAYSQDGQMQYKYGCQLSNNYEYCDYSCIYCGAFMENGRHAHYTSTSHSVNHK